MYWHLKIIYRDISKGEWEEVLKSMGAVGENRVYVLSLMLHRLSGILDNFNPDHIFIFQKQYQFKKIILITPSH